MSGDVPDNVTTTSVSKTELTPQQESLLNSIVPVAQDFVDNPPTAFEGDTFAGFTENQKAAQQGVLDVAGGSAQNLVNQVTGAQEFALGGALDPNSNPFLPATIDAAIRPLNQSFEQTIVPAITQGAVGAGQQGGSRQGIAEGIAGQELIRQQADIATNIMNNAFNRGMDTFDRGLAVAPQTAGLLTLPQQLQESVGAQEQAMIQAAINDEINRFLQDQQLPFAAAQDVANIAFGLPGGTQTSNVSGPPNFQNPGVGAQLLGGASLGSSIGGAISPGKTGTGLGALGGALLGLL